MQEAYQELLQSLDYKKKLFKFNPKKQQTTQLKVQKTKEKVETIKISPQSNESGIREMLSRKVSGVFVGLWLLIAEHLRLGSWDLLNDWNNFQCNDLSARIGMQMVNESALCVNGIRKRNYMCHQGFEIANGLSDIVTDEEIHNVLSRHTISDSIQMQINLGKLRLANGHYNGKLLAIDPHRIITYSKRVMPKKKKLTEKPSEKMLQTYFCIDAETGQPLGFMIGSSARRTTTVSIDLLEMIDRILEQPALLLADKEHYSDVFFSTVKHHDKFDIISPAPNNHKIISLLKEMDYERKWAGYSVAKQDYFFERNKKDKFYLLGQRSGEIPEDYQYNGFISTVDENYLKMLSQDYDNRWSIEEFFNFEADMGWNRASTMNLNVRYGKMSLALIAQAACYQLRKNLPNPYKQWTANTLADTIFRGIDGDIRTVDDTILVTFYNASDNFNLKKSYANLPNKLIAEGVNPKIPWLYNFKLDFRFK